MLGSGTRKHKWSCIRKDVAELGEGQEHQQSRPTDYFDKAWALDDLDGGSTTMGSGTRRMGGQVKEHMEFSAQPGRSSRQARVGDAGEAYKVVHGGAVKEAAGGRRRWGVREGLRSRGEARPTIAVCGVATSCGEGQCWAMSPSTYQRCTCTADGRRTSSYDLLAGNSRNRAHGPRPRKWPFCGGATMLPRRRAHRTLPGHTTTAGLAMGTGSSPGSPWG
jgi:hypothetical protein